MFPINASNKYLSPGSCQYQQIQEALKSLNRLRKNDLENILTVVYTNSMITKKEKIEIEKLFDEISSFVEENFSNVIVCLYGSHVNGLANKDSDLDFTILFHDGKYFSNLPKSVQKLKLSIIYPYLFRLKKYLNLTFIAKARIPIVKLKTKSGVNADISIDNFEALRNTHVIKEYSDLDSRVIVLGQLLKGVIKLYKIGEAYDGTLSPFGYILMLIHYLQTKKVLPVLHEEDFDYNPSPDFNECNKIYPTEKIIEPSRNFQELGIVDLWLGFFKYYTMEFDIKNNVVSIRRSIVTKSEKSWDYYLSIENPLDCRVNVASHLKLSNVNKIFDSFSDVLLHKGNIKEIIVPISTQLYYKTCKPLLNLITTQEQGGSDEIKENVVNKIITDYIVNSISPIINVLKTDYHSDPLYPNQRMRSCTPVWIRVTGTSLKILFGQRLRYLLLITIIPGETLSFKPNRESKLEAKP